MAEHENSIGASDDWHTPLEIFDALGLRFDLDPCTPTDRTHYYVPADRHYTKEDDGLVQSWHGLVFMNPPFSTRYGHLPWLRKFFDHGNGVAICRSYTSCDWWHGLIVPRAETLLFPEAKPNSSDLTEPSARHPVTVSRWSVWARWPTKRCAAPGSDGSWIYAVAI